VGMAVLLAFAAGAAIAAFAMRRGKAGL